MPFLMRGTVSKAGAMKKTVTVTVSRYIMHKKTGKRIERRRKILVHDENGLLRPEDEVQIRHCRPLSARKRFTLDKILASPEAQRSASRAVHENAQTEPGSSRVVDTPSLPSAAEHTVPQSSQKESSSDIAFLKAPPFVKAFTDAQHASKKLDTILDNATKNVKQKKREKALPPALDLKAALRGVDYYHEVLLPLTHDLKSLQKFKEHDPHASKSTPTW